VGVLILNGQQRALQIMRKQTDDGERVEIALAEMPGLLTWMRGGRVDTSSRADDTVRALIERLVLDSPISSRSRNYAAPAITRSPAVSADGRDERYAGPLWTSCELTIRIGTRNAGRRARGVSTTSIPKPV